LTLINVKREILSMKKNKLIVGLICIISGTLLFKNFFVQTTVINGIKYKVTVNGISQTAIPLKNDVRGPFTITTDCGTTKSSWDYANWKLNIAAATSSTKCNISFTNVVSNDYLINYIISNVGTTQGTSSTQGQIVNEGIDNAIKRLNSNPTYTTLSTADDYGTAEYDSAGGQISSKYTFSNSKWINTAAMSSYIYNKITIPENGYYQLYWSNTNTSSSYYFYAYKPNSTSTATSGYNKSTEQVYDYGYLSAGDYINISAKSSAANQITFYLKKSTNYTTNSVHRGYRYEGSNPYNYVLFNNELWRIIGVFAFDKTTNMESGSSNTLDCNTYNCYTKIIRNESIGGYAFSTVSVAVNEVYSYWENTSGAKGTLNTLLNTYYYNATDGTGQNECKSYGNETTRDCDFSINGIQGEYRSMVQNVVWNLGGTSVLNTAQTIYTMEREARKCSICTNASSASGYIGLIYPSDYGFSVLSNSCPRATILNSYNNERCGGKAWMLQNGYEWTMIPPETDTYGSSLSIIGESGRMQSEHAESGLAVRPVLYLSDKVYIVQGTGKIDDPYVLGLDTSS